MSINCKFFGILADGRRASAFTLRNKNGVKVKITDFGGTILQIKVPDRDGRFSDIVCGYDSLDDYVKADGYQGALIGRFGNRIALGRFELDGRVYNLEKNNGENHLHGGNSGFDHKLWNAEILSDGDEPELQLGCVSPDGEEGYPGTLKVKVIYKLSKYNELSISYRAETDKKTIINLTNHTYFNLGGYASGKIFDHVLMLDADTYLPTDAGLIPTGEIKSVAGTPFDFRKAKSIGRDFFEDNKDLKLAGGYDHCLNFTGGAKEAPVLRGTLFCPKNGRLMELYTDRPSVQLYTANFMKNPNFPFKNGLLQEAQCAVCLETQYMPDSINHANFTNCILEPGKVFSSTTIYKFSVK